MSGSPVTGWTLRSLDGPAPQGVAGLEIAAAVPGTVHTDLLAAGLIPDPYLDENEQQVSWIGRTSWRYAATLPEVLVGAPAPDGEHVELVFEGLDTVCDVRFGGVLLGSPRNMHRTHRFDVTDLVRADQTELVVDFAAQLTAAEHADEELGPRIHTNAHPFNAIRKMACNFGWDWGPDLVTAGIWRPVTMQRWAGARLGAVRTLATVPAGAGHLEIHAQVVRDTEQPLHVRVDCAGQTTTVEAVDDTVAVLEIADVALWWPRGYGDQPLYDLGITLLQDAAVLDERRQRVGFRTVELDTSPDDRGTPFVLHHNGKPLLVKGANWIPDDCFPHRVDRARYETRIADATDAGVNLLRVWGGGIYESDDFYDVCDERGVLVWQDAQFACAAYAEEPPLRDEVVAEVTEAVTRLSPHASLVIWNGNNENLWGHEDGDWRRQLGDLTWGRGYYLDLLPRLIGSLDPTRPYSPGSPWSFDERIPANDPNHGTTHLWDVWNRLDYTAYRASVPRFVAEFGYQGPPTWTTLTAAVHDEPLTPTSPAMANHQKAEDGDLKLRRGIAPHLHAPGVASAKNMEDWHWAMSVQQARAVAFGIEHLRSWHPVCSGMVVWQLNDCWPVTSWAVVDSTGHRKPAWHAVRHAYAPRLLTVQPRDGHLALVVDNDTDEPWDAAVLLARRTFDGHDRSVSRTHTLVPARGTVTVPLAQTLTADVAPGDDVLVAECDGARAQWFFAEDRDLLLTDQWGSTSAERTADGYAVHLTATTVQRDVTLLVDKVDTSATVDDGMVTLLPGDTFTFTVSSSKRVDPQRFLDPCVLRSTNQLVNTTLSSQRQPGALSHA